MRIGRHCSICNDWIDPDWTDMCAPKSVGATCRLCANKRDEVNLIDSGLIRNIQSVKSDFGESSFEAELLITDLSGKDVWIRIYSPCGNWCYVDHPDVFSAKIGHYEFRRLYALQEALKNGVL